MNKQQKKIALLVALGAVIVVGLIVIIFNLSSAQTATVYQSNVVARNIQHPHKINQDTVRFFTGSAFAEYNTKTDETTSLTREFRLPKVTEVRWYKNSVYFAAVNLTRSDELYPRLNSQKDMIKASTWWQINFQNNRLTMVNAPGINPTTIEDFIRAPSQNNTSYVLVKDSGQTLYKRTEQDLTELKSFSGDTVVKLLGEAVEGGLLVQENTSVLKITENSQETIAENITEASLDPSGKYLVALGFNPQENSASSVAEYQPETTALAFTNLAQNNTTTLVADFKGSYTVSRDGIFTLTPQEDRIRFTSQFYPFGEETRTDLVVEINSDKLGLPKEIEVLNASPFRIMAIDNQDNAWLLVQGQESLLEEEGVKLSAFEKDLINLPNGYMQYEFPENKLKIFVSSKQSFNKSQKQVLRAIEKKGVDPHQIEKEWSLVNFERRPAVIGEGQTTE